VKVFVVHKFIYRFSRSICSDLSNFNSVPQSLKSGRGSFSHRRLNMQIDIQFRGFELTPDLREHTDRRARLALARMADRVQRVAITVNDVNGPRGGADKHCIIVVSLSSLSDVVVEDIAQDLRAVLDRSLARAARSVTRRISRSSKPRYASRRVVMIARPEPFASA
jgi:putative sigma-54 modulation protein